MSENPIPTTADAPLADRIAGRSLAPRAEAYAAEVRALLDAGLSVMQRCGTESRPRVSDIVAEAGLSNDAFYRHFPSKEALVEAILTDGAERLLEYLAHQMDKERSPEGRVRRWVEGVLAQAIDREVAAATLAVLWNANSLSGSPGLATGPLAGPLRDAYADLGSADPELDASLAAHAVVGKLSEFLWSEVPPSPDQVEHVVSFCLAPATLDR